MEHEDDHPPGMKQLEALFLWVKREENHQIEKTLYPTIRAIVPRRLVFPVVPIVDPVHSYLLSLKKIELPLINDGLQSTAVLTSLFNHGLGDYISGTTQKALSLVNKYCKNKLTVPWQVAFGPKEDLPRARRVAFDVYYFLAGGKFHRLTLTRTMVRKIGEYLLFACFLDSQLLFISRKVKIDKRRHVDHIVFESEKVLFMLLPEKKKNCLKRKFGVEIEGATVEIHQRNHEDQFSNNALVYSYYPQKYNVFINGLCTSSGKTLKVHQNKFNFYELCNLYSVLSYIFICLLPIYVIFVIIAKCCVGLCMNDEACVVRKYFLYPGHDKHVILDEKKLASESDCIISVPSDPPFSSPLSSPSSSSSSPLFRHSPSSSL